MNFMQRLGYSSYVADAQGGINVGSHKIKTSQRLEQELSAIKQDMEKSAAEQGRPFAEAEFVETWKKMRTFDSAFNFQAIEDQRNIYLLTGVDLGTEDVAHPAEDTFSKALRHLVRSNFVHEITGNVIRISGAESLRRARRENKPGMIFHLAGTGGFAETDTPIENLDIFYALAFG